MKKIILPVCAGLAILLPALSFGADIKTLGTALDALGADAKGGLSYLMDKAIAYVPWVAGGLLSSAYFGKASGWEIATRFAISGALVWGMLALVQKMLGL
jgi:hypothetical protein